jgi:thiamine biosynthesis lipoprotein
MPPLTLARNAMATRFEIVLHGDNAPALRAAGEEALDEIARLENQLSLYRPGSEIAQLNARAAREAVQVTPELFALLQHAQKLSVETGGAFDITIAPLVRCWGFMNAKGRMPAPEEIAAARELVGMEKVLLDAGNRTVRFARDGVMLDLGAIGKGYAVERAAEFLHEAGVTSALIHGGTSTVCAIGRPPETEAWKIALDVAAELERRSPTRPETTNPQPRAESVLGAPVTILLCDESLSVSAASGRQFEFEGRKFGHVIDPRSGQPTDTALFAAVALPSATETDALSTALLTLGFAGQDFISPLRSGMRTLVIRQQNETLETSLRGF